MNAFYTFHKSVRGHVHQLRQLPLQDASASYSDENDRFHIAVVADGHGDPSCMRSADGSSLAAEVAKDCLICFASEIMNGQVVEGAPSAEECLSIQKYKNAALKRLTDSIISRWYSAVHQNAVEHPLGESELEQAGSLVHAYGTTLIAALMLPGQLVLIQQGDGLCCVLYTDGGVAQPIPPDQRCCGNVTTSLCDADAAEGIRSCVIDLREKPVAACYLGSDGVEDSFRDEAGTAMFYRSLTCEFQDRGAKTFEDYLSEMLPQFSAGGSGDDVSVSGIIAVDSIADLAPVYRTQVKRHHLEEQMTGCEQRKASMSRKHGILHKRMREARNTFETLRTRLSAEKSALKQTEAEYQMISRKTENAQADWQASAKQYEDIRAGIGNDTPEKLNIIEGLAHSHRIFLNSYQEKRDRLEIRLSTQRKALQDLEREVDEARRQYQLASDEYAEYDRSYQGVLAEIGRIALELSNLKAEDSSVGEAVQVPNQPETQTPGRPEPEALNQPEPETLTQPEIVEPKPRESELPEVDKAEPFEAV